MDNLLKSSEVVIFQNDDESVKVEVRHYKETLWLSLNQISSLFERDKSVISRHIKNIYKDEELEKNATVAFFATVQQEGKRNISRQVEYFNLDMIISVGYRVNSKRGTQFRKWSNKILQEYLLKDYVINKLNINTKGLK